MTIGIIRFLVGLALFIWLCTYFIDFKGAMLLGTALVVMFHGFYVIMKNKG